MVYPWISLDILGYSCLSESRFLGWPVLLVSCNEHTFVADQQCFIALATLAIVPGEKVVHKRLTSSPSSPLAPLCGGRLGRFLFTRPRFVVFLLAAAAGVAGVVVVAAAAHGGGNEGYISGVGCARATTAATATRGGGGGGCARAATATTATSGGGGGGGGGGARASAVTAGGGGGGGASCLPGGVAFDDFLPCERWG
jgi:hypothetical protein